MVSVLVFTSVSALSSLISDQGLPIVLGWLLNPYNIKFIELIK